MTLNELIKKIHDSQSVSIEVERKEIRHGNRGGAGDYQVLILKIDGQKILFKLENNEWVSA